MTPDILNVFLDGEYLPRAVLVGWGEEWPGEGPPSGMEFVGRVWLEVRDAIPDREPEQRMHTDLGEMVAYVGTVKIFRDEP